MNETMTDDELNATLENIAMNWSVIAKRKLQAHIAALAAERDELKAMFPWHRGDAGVPDVPVLQTRYDAIRERVQVLEGEADLMKERATNSEKGRERARESNAALQSHLAAIRQRAGDERRMAEHALPSEKAGLVTRAIDRILDDDSRPRAPPEAFTHEKGLDAGVFRSEDEDPPLLLPKTPARPNSTTAEAFATVRSYIADTWDDDGGNAPLGTSRTMASLSLLERHMGAMERAIRDSLEACRCTREGPTPELCPFCSGLEAALTDAPPVFTLEEVKEALGRGSTVDDVVAILTALRK